MRIKQLLLFGAGIAAVGLASTTQGSSINLITNGDFETGSTAPFTVANTNGDNVNIETTGYYGVGNHTDDGNYFLTFNGGNSPTGGSISQAFATTAGQTYLVSYAIGVLNGNTQRMDVSVLAADDTTVLATDSHLTSSGNPLDSHSFTFVATGMQSTVKFLDDINNPTNATDLALDNISVVNVLPEPASLGLLGVACIGLLGRRRRVRA